MRQLPEDSPNRLLRGAWILLLVWLGGSALLAALVGTQAPPDLIVLVDDASRLAVSLGVGWAIRVRRRHSGRDAAYWLWLQRSVDLISCSCLYVILTIDVFSLPPPIPTLRHLCYLGSLGCLAGAILHYHPTSVAPRFRLQSILDGALISSTLFFVAWDLFLRDLVLKHHTPGTPYALTLAYPLLSIGIGAGLLFQEARCRRLTRGLPQLLQLAGLCLLILWWPSYAVGSIQGWYRAIGPSITMDILSMSAYLCLGLAALWHEDPGPEAPSMAHPAQRNLIHLAAPLLAMAFGASLLFRERRLDPVMTAMGLLIGLILIYRQHRTVSELDRLSGALEQHLEERTRQLAWAQNQLLSAQRSQNVAGLFSSVSHDLKNLINVIQNWAWLLKGEEDPALQAEAAEGISTVSTQCADLIQKTLSAGRLQEQVPQQFRLATFFQAVQKNLACVLGDAIPLEVHLESEALTVFMDPERFEHVLINLASNAKDATEGPGLFRIRAWSEAAAPRTCFEISDTGRGMAPEVLERIFEPFYTTKPEGKGTGLGLSSVFSLVVQGGGTLSVTSQPGQGTCFRIDLPSQRPAPTHLTHGLPDA